MDADQHRTTRRARGGLLPWLVFGALLALVVVFRDEMAAPFVGGGAVGGEEAEPATGGSPLAEESEDARHPTGDAGGPAPTALMKGGVDAPEGGPILDGGTAAARDHAAAPEDLASGAQDVGDPGEPADTASASGAPASTARPATSGGSAPGAASSGPASTDPVVTDRTATGLVRYGLDPDADVPRAAPAPAPDAPLRALETAPADPEALDAAVAFLVERDRWDEALELVVRFVEEGGDPDVADEHRRTLDPFERARAAVLLDGARGLADTSTTFRDKAMWIVRAATLEAAERVARAALLECGPSTRAPFEALLDELRESRAILHRRRVAVQRLAAFGAPLPPDVDVRSRLERLAAEARDARVGDKRATFTATTSRVHATTTDSSLLAHRLAETVLTMYDELAARTGETPWRRLDRLEVELLDARSTFDARRAQASGPVHEDGFLVGERGLVLLDPRLRGATLAALWGAAARETARRFLRDVAAEHPDRELPPWLEEALCLDWEGARLLADGTLRFDDLPADRLDELANALAGRGPAPVPLGSVLEQLPGNTRAATWAWSLGRYLREARDDDGTLLWADGWPALLERPGADAPVRAFERAFLDDADRPPPAGLDNPGAIERHWQAWARREAALDAGEEDAVRAATAEVRRLRDAREWDACRALLRRARAARPDHPDVLQLTVEIADRTGRPDEALLAAWHLAALRTPSQHWTVAGGLEPQASGLAEQGARIRYAEAVVVHEALGTTLATRDDALREAVLPLVDEMLAAGYPRSAVRLLDAVLASQPLDAGYGSVRRAIVDDVLGAEDVLATRRVSWGERMEEVAGDHAWFEEAGGGLTGASSSGLLARAGDRVEPVSLRGLLALAPPWRVSVRVAFAPDEDGRFTDDGTRYAGLLFGAPEPSAWGTWGVLVAPSGSVELASPGRLEWPSRSIGRGPRGDLVLEVRVDGDRLELHAGDRLLRRLPLGTRAAAGWLGVFVRHADVRLLDLRVTRSRRPDPRASWWTRGGG